MFEEQNKNVPRFRFMIGPAGVTAVEVMTAHVWTQLLVMLVQVALLLVFALAVFKVSPERGASGAICAVDRFFCRCAGLSAVRSCASSICSMSPVTVW